MIAPSILYYDPGGVVGGGVCVPAATTSTTIKNEFLRDGVISLQPPHCIYPPPDGSKKAYDRFIDELRAEEDLFVKDVLKI